MRKHTLKKLPIVRKKKSPALKPWVFLSIIGTIILATILSFATPYLIPSSTLLGWMDENVGRPLGARVNAKDIRLKSFPYLGFSIDELGVASDAGPFQGLNILSAGRVSGTLSIAGLIDGKVITTIDAGQVHADLRVADVQTNIEEILAASAAQKNSDSSLVIKSLNVSDGGINIWKDNSLAVSLKKVSLATARVDFSGGPGANFEMKAVFAGTPIGIAGQALLDEGSSTVFLRGIKSAIAGSHITTDASLSVAAKPAQFDIHMASTNLNREACAVILAFFPAWGSRFLSWDGIMSADASVKGSQQGFEINAGLDATLAKIESGDFFTKPAGLPLKISAAIGGAMNSSVATAARGIFKADGLKIAGVALSNAEGSFEHATPPGEAAGAEFSARAISFPTFKADVLGGSVSGNGIVSLGKTDGFNFDLVADRVDTGAVSALGGALTGASSMVIKAVSFGSDTAEIAKNLTMTGTFVSPSAVWAKKNPLSELFSLETLNTIETMSGGELAETEKAELAEIGLKIENFSASFLSSADGVKISEASWKNPQYTARVRGEFDLSKRLAGEGEIILSKEIAGGLALPVLLSGIPPELIISLDQAKFEEFIKSRPAVAAEPPPKEAKETKKQVAVVKPVEETKPASKKIQPEAKPVQQKAPPPKGPNQEEEDILKVIVGE